MKEGWNFTQCVSVMKKEIELLRQIFAAQNMVKQAVLNREWADFDEKVEQVNRIGGNFSALEDERLFLVSCIEDETDFPAVKKPFYALMTRLPFEESGELARLHRELKTEALRIRALNETFLVYLNEAKNMTAAYIEAVCPARGGKLYTRKGSKVSQDLRSMVFNNRF